MAAHVNRMYDRCNCMFSVVFCRTASQKQGRTDTTPLMSKGFVPQKPTMFDCVEFPAHNSSDGMSLRVSRCISFGGITKPGQWHAEILSTCPFGSAPFRVNWIWRKVGSHRFRPLLAHFYSDELHCGFHMRQLSGELWKRAVRIFFPSPFSDRSLAIRGWSLLLHEFELRIWIQVMGCSTRLQEWWVQAWYRVSNS